jgi:hypothetical protein
MEPGGPALARGTGMRNPLDRELREHPRAPDESVHGELGPQDEGPEPSDPMVAGPPFPAETYGQVVEVRPGDEVDPDWNGAPELEGVEETEEWSGDVLEAMQGREAQEQREQDEPPTTELLAGLVAERRQVLIERAPEARALGVEALFNTALQASDPTSGETPVLPDEDALREQLSLLDDAMEELERLSTERGAL